MYASDPRQVLWTREDFDGQDHPEESIQFLVEVGLPPALDGTTIEFGEFNSADEFVIGIDFEYPIVLASNGEVWERNKDIGDCFYNTSVQQLSRCIHEVFYAKKDSEEEPGEKFHQDLFERLREIDPAIGNAAVLQLWRSLLFG